jgi:hypothetical protein
MATNRIYAVLAAWALMAAMASAQQQGQYAPYPPANQQGQQGQYAPYPPQDPNQGYAQPMGQYPPNVVPEGTSLLVRLTDTLDVNKLQPGKRFEGKLAEDLITPNGQVLIPHDKRVRGHVSGVDRGLHGRLLLSFDQIETRHGWIPLIATVTGVPGEHGVKQQAGPEGEISSRGVSPVRAVESAVAGAAIGAVAGGVAAGAHGAAIGAAAGAGLGATAGILTDRNLRLQKNTVLEVRVDRQMVVPQS